MLETLTTQPPDELLSLIKQFRDDPRKDKLDLGVGVYRDEHGITPVMRAIKAAEKQLANEQQTKSYLGPEGDLRYVELVQSIVFGGDNPKERIAGLQTPGGSGALRVAGELVVRAQPDARIWISKPTWPNHRPILAGAGARVDEYPYFDIRNQTLQFDQMMSALQAANRGDVVLIHGACHNPSGSDLDHAQWDALIELLSKRGVVPLIDLAYQGLGKGLEEDAYGVRQSTQRLEEVMVAQSCDKNFALYRERTGALFVVSKDRNLVASNLAASARANWSMPPDHGAAAVKIVLETPGLEKAWRDELTQMRERILAVRSALAAADPALKAIGTQQGLFSNLPLTPEMAVKLRTDHGIYLSSSGRINVAGLKTSDAAHFAEALRSVGCLN